MVFGETIEGQNYREREAVYGLIFDECNQIGIIKTPRGYFLPGGGIDDEETHEQCLIREFREETGFGIEVEVYIGNAVLNGYAPTIKEYLKMVGYFYRVKLTGETYEKIEEDHELLWIGIEEAEKSMKLEHQAWAINVSKSQ